MYVTACSSESASASILRAARVIFCSQKLHFSSFGTQPSSFITYCSFKLSLAVRSRGSHGVDWRSPVSLRAQIRTAAPIIERFKRNITTMDIAPEHHFKEILTFLPKPRGGDFGKFYSLPALIILEYVEVTYFDHGGILPHVIRNSAK